MISIFASSQPATSLKQKRTMPIQASAFNRNSLERDFDFILVDESRGALSEPAEHASHAAAASLASFATTHRVSH
jgi:hypothetical protein